MWESVASFHSLGPRDGSQVVSLDSEHLYRLSHLAGSPPLSQASFIVVESEIYAYHNYTRECFTEAVLAVCVKSGGGMLESRVLSF